MQEQPGRDRYDQLDDALYREGDSHRDRLERLEPRDEVQNVEHDADPGGPMRHGRVRLGGGSDLEQDLAGAELAVSPGAGREVQARPRQGLFRGQHNWKTPQGFFRGGSGRATEPRTS